MASNKRVLVGCFVVLGVAASAQGCGSESTNFNSGGSSTGGSNTGGSNTGGSNTGGTSTGGSNTGGTSTGGMNTGGSSTGGANTGGTSTGGSNTGGTSTGGSSTGGSAGTNPTGGDSGSDTGGSAGAGATGGASGGSSGGQGGGSGGLPTACYPESDAMDMCGRQGAACLCCPIGGPAQTCICTTACTESSECTDRARPVCNIDKQFTETGICAPEGFICRWGARCAAPNTPIATPRGERPIAELEVGDLVYSVEGGAVVVVPLRSVQRIPVTSAHEVSRVTLASGAVLEISAGHPTADGRTFADLRAGHDLLGTRIERVVHHSAYPYPFTHDILPDSSTGAYFAAGALIGSTLAEPQ